MMGAKTSQKSRCI